MIARPNVFYAILNWEGCEDPILWWCQLTASLCENSQEPLKNINLQHIPLAKTKTAVCNYRGITRYLMQIVIAPLQGHIRRNSSGRVDVTRNANLGANNLCPPRLFSTKKKGYPNHTLYAKTAFNITLSSIVQSTCNIDWLCTYLATDSQSLSCLLGRRSLRLR